MAKKQEIKKETVEAPVVETPVVETPKAKKVEPKKPEWEVKNRFYYLKGKSKPLSRIIKSANLYWFDEEKGYEREIKYCANQTTPFVDEMRGDQRMSHIIFRNGVLYVEKEKTILQKFLSIYHPDRDKIFFEHKPAEVAAKQVDRLELEADAIVLARELDVDMAEAILRVENGSGVSNLSSKELKRDLLLFARNNPILFLELAADDNVQLRNFGIKATELGIITLSEDQRNFSWSSTGRKLMTVPFDEHPYTALALGLKLMKVWKYMQI